MAVVQEVQLQIGESPGLQHSLKDSVTDSHLPQLPSTSKGWRLWLKAALYSSCILVGQTAATLLGRFYYDQGGNSKWMATFVSSAGFPLLLPLLLYPPRTVVASPNNPIPRPSIRILAPIYIGLGLIATVDNLMYSYGLLYLPVSTYTLVCATQLAFNAVFSYFINSQKFTYLIFNSVVLVTVSAALLGFDSSSEGPSDVSKSMIPLGFILTAGASATFALILSLIQLTFQKVLKRETFSLVVELQFWTGIVATAGSVVGLFASGEWRELKGEMSRFDKGKASYVMTLVWTAILWQINGMGVVGLSFVLSSLFSNMICTFVLPLIPIFAVVFFHDKMDGVYIMAMLIAIWGSVSYIYQDYLDYLKAKNS